MTEAELWKDIATAIASGDANEDAHVGRVVTFLLSNDDATEKWVRRTVTKRIRDMIASHVKDTGRTSRVPAGQKNFGWLELDPSFAVARLRRQVRVTYAAMERAAIHAQLLGVLDASGLEPSSFDTFGALCDAAHVPAELVGALAA